MDISDTYIKEFRKKFNLSQSDLASLVGVTLRTIQNYEKGTIIPKSKYEIFLNVFKKYEEEDPNTDYHIGKNKQLKLNEFLDVFFLYKDKIEKTERFKEYLQNIEDKAVSKYQHELISNMITKNKKE